MGSFRNRVTLVGNVGDEPTITNFENGKKGARLSLATPDNYRDKDGNKVEETDWHTVVAYGKTAEIIEKYVTKGKQIGVSGMLKTRSYETQDGNTRYVTEVKADEILLLGSKA